MESQTVTASGSDDGTVRAWDADGLAMTTTFEDEIVTVAAAADDGLAAPLGILRRRLDREFMI
ncbi:hypothetical protein [Actinomadura sp. 3N508]|uniref:hypothetical protein n=1 Tax=Actinomadura sp. 3N508 TaxID=3375153 RepID=UPI0037AED1A0